MVLGGAHLCEYSSWLYIQFLQAGTNSGHRDSWKHGGREAAVGDPRHTNPVGGSP